jgi:SAM domain (Sterile alpha motif)
VTDDISRWLEGLGLGNYAKAFAENGIDLDILPSISDDDLKGLGLNLGDRRRVQRALRSLPPEEIRPATARPSPERTTAPSEAERRQLTVLFCDLRAWTCRQRCSASRSRSARPAQASRDAGNRPGYRPAIWHSCKRPGKIPGIAFPSAPDKGLCGTNLACGRSAKHPTGFTLTPGQACDLDGADILLPQIKVGRKWHIGAEKADGEVAAGHAAPTTLLLSRYT